ncbi:contactin-associated protein-like 5 isoform X2 [Ixodes scapularis]
MGCNLGKGSQPDDSEVREDGKRVASGATSPQTPPPGALADRMADGHVPNKDSNALMSLDTHTEDQGCLVTSGAAGWCRQGSIAAMVCQRGFWTFSAVCSLLHLVGVVEFGARAQSDAGDVVTVQPSQSSGTGGDSSTNRAGGYKLSSSQVFTFLKESSFLRVEPKYWPLQQAREVSFQFKTEKPHGLLFYHLLEESSEEDRVPNYELYVMLENGRLKIIHIFNTEGNEVFYMGKGLNQDRWHTVNLRVVPSKGEMRIRVDHEDLTIILSSLMHRGGYDIGTEDTPSHLYIGSIDPRNSSVDLHYNTDSFFGCLGKISFHLGDGAPVEASLVAREDVIDGCVDLCSKYDYCLNGGRCVNHYSYYGCDCFGTRYEDHMCGYDNLTTVTLRGNSYITYRIYDWKDRVHSDSNRIGIVFRLYVPEAVLFTVTGEHDPKNEVAASVKGGMLFFHLDFGDGPFNVTMGANLHDQMWHNFTMIHNANQVSLYLDKLSHSIRLTDTNHHLHLDPDLYIGGVPLTSRDGTAVFPGLVTDLKLVGCIREVYFNRDNCLQSLRKGEPNARHIGIFPVEYGCALVDTIPLTFPFAESRLKLNLPSARRLDISVDFKTHQNETVIASSLLRSDKGQGFWEIRLKKGTAIFTIVPDETNPSHYWFLSKGKQLTDGQWHQVGVVFENEVVELTIDFNRKLRDTYNRPVELVGPLVIGGFPKEHVMGFVGCIRDIYVAKEWVDPRKVVGTEYAHGEVSLDNCRLINLCNNPNACEHGGQCYLEGNQFKCNCNGTGYTGKTCHFSTYKRTCQELFLVGYRKSGTYKIDIDRNGPLPPAHVECDMQRPDGSIATKVNHNMQREMVVRKYGLEGFYMDITYREFTPEMLQSLIYASKQCYQHITYECFKAPLGLQSYTWMESSADNRYVSSIGSDHPAWCQCAETRSCSNASRLCNCDVGDARWRLDEGVYHRKEDLGIVRIYMLQPKGLAHDAEARMTLGPLECTDTNTQQYVITFKTAPSYLEVQTGWRRGDLAFSFRTSSKRAVVLYQAALHDKHGYLLAMITSDYELSFEYTVNGEPRIVKLLSRSRLNTGEWQQVWLDHDTHHMRFTVNLDSVMVDLGKDEGVGPFEGPLYIGGAPKDLLTHPDITEGFIGCFRGLIINNHVVNLYNHLSRRVPDIVMDCQPSCSSNPCQNGATCHENWGSYNCECENSLAHSGTNCENNLNQNSMTFITSSSCYHRATLGNISDPVLAENILLSFRTYQSEALLLYSFNHLNNFVQLHFEKRKRVVFTFNSQRSIVQGFVEAPDLATGRIVQVFVDRHADYTVLQVNGNNVTIPHPAVFLTTYYKDPWIQGEQLELVKPARGTFESVPNSQMYLGGVDFMGATTNLPGLVGCLQGLRIGNVQVDLIKDVENQNVTKGQIRPGCKMMCDSTPCHHSGLCIEDWKNNLTSCDCSMTSYQGDVCQTDIGAQFDGKAWIEYMFMPETSGQDRISILLAFSTKAKASVRQAILLVQQRTSRSKSNVFAATYKRTCQELFLVGYRKSGTYKIDIDRNGPLPPAHVECDMQRPDGSIATKVNHNMQREMVVRKYGLEGFYMDITYREFTPEMLQSLIYASKQCYQHITYECFKAPLGLQSYTWMESSADNRYVSSIGSDHPAWCQCAETRSCSNASRLCNCDVGDARWRLDEGVYHRKEDLGIVRIYMLQPKGLAHDAEARMTLGPLECTDTNTQQYVITFKTAPSYLEVQTGWRRGDLAFSFRTSSKRAVVLYQAALHDKHGYLLAMITSADTARLLSEPGQESDGAHKVQRRSSLRKPLTRAPVPARPAA